HEQVAPPRTPTKALAPDMTLGWFALSLPVSDIRRSCAFYEKLGFRPVGGKLEDRHLTLQNRDARIALYQGHLEPPDEPQLIFWQGDVRATAATMMAHGGTPIGRFETGPIETEEHHVACFLRDPDGQAIY